MPPKFDINQIKLLELYSSSEYFAELRDNWQTMVEHVEKCLANFMSTLPPKYRSLPLPEQPDIVWGNRVIPNFRHTLNGLIQGYILLTHGDTSGLGAAHGVRSDFKGQMDFWAGWMSKTDETIYEENINLAVRMASNICFTELADWPDVPVQSRIHDLERINKNPKYCSYQVNPNVFVQSGEKIGTKGIYVPDIEKCCPQFLGTHLRSAPLTSIHVDTEDLFNPENGEKYDERKIYKDAKCIWYLVESKEYVPNTAIIDDAANSELIRVAGGEPCPQTGFYFTPAKSNSRKFFIKSDPMPSIETDYGKTIWQWDTNQK